MTKDLDTITNISKLYQEISNILNTARANVYKAVNFAMVTSYWSPLCQDRCRLEGGHLYEVYQDI